MPNPQQPHFDHEASLEELAGVGESRRFDEVIDDEGVMNGLVTTFGVSRFSLDFTRDFKTPDDIAGAVTLLP